MTKRRKTITCMIIILSIFVQTSMTQVRAAPSPTKVSVVQEVYEIGSEDIEINQTNPTDPFIVNITVTNVTNLYSWDVRLYYNTTVLNCTRAWYPSDHVFAGKTTISVPPVINPPPGVAPPGEEARPNPYVQWGNLVLYPEDAFNGTGTLCQIEFVGWAGGYSPLNITTYYYPPPVNYTYPDKTTLINNTAGETFEIPCEKENGYITVKSKSPGPGPGPGPTNFTISSLSITPAEVAPNEKVQISVNVTNIGDIEDIYNVTLKINDEIERVESTEILAPNATTRVTFNVTREEEGTYNVEVDGKTGTFTVKAEEAPPINWWLIAGVILLVVIVGGAVILYKRRRTQF